MIKVVACYTVFNGEELLQNSIRQIEESIDVFLICFQTISNKGEKNEPLLAFLNTLKSTKQIILLSYYPIFELNTKQNERKKHQIMLEYARFLGATHVLLAACDHFYEEKQFKDAVNYSIDNDYDVTFTSMFTYFKNPEWQLTPKEDYYMPLIIKLHPETKISNEVFYPIKVDPSVKINTFNKWKLFSEEICVLHHYSMIRKDIESKFKNAAAGMRWTNAQVKTFKEEYTNYNIEKNPGLTYFQGRKIKIVENYFNI